MKKPEYPENHDSMSEEEKAEFDRRLEKMLNEPPQLMGLVQSKDPAPVPPMQMMYGPPPAPNDYTGFMGIAPIPTESGKWLDDTRWVCVCGMENTTKYCPECGMKAPARAWICPECGTENNGRFCSGCGNPYKGNL